MIEQNGHVTRFAVELKMGLRPVSFGAVSPQLEARGPRVLLVADDLSPPWAIRLREKEIPYLDAVGNASSSDPPLWILVTGRKRDRKLQSGVSGRIAFQASRLRIIFSLLFHPDCCNQPFRSLSKHAGVATGTAGRVMTELIGLLRNYGRGLRGELSLA